MAELVVVSGPAGYNAKAIADKLRAKFVEVEHKTFPDGEVYVRIPARLEGSIAVVVQSLYPNQDRRIMELLLMLEAAKGLGASKTIAVVPYMAYARQDKRFREGEPISIKVLLQAIRGAGADALITVDIHKPESLSFFEGLAYNIDPSPIFAEAVKNEENVVVIAPDRGALNRARSLATKLGVEYDYLEKFRDRVTGEITVKPKEIPVKDKTVIITDDIISTGGTIAEAAKILRKLGARRIVVTVSHALLVGNAMEKLAKAGVNRLIALDTVPVRQGVEVYSIAGLIAEHIEKLASEEGWLS